MLDRLAKLLKVSPREIDPLRVMHRAVGRNPVQAGEAILRDVDRDVVSLVNELAAQYNDAGSTAQ